MWIWHSGTRFGAGTMVRLDDLGGLFQPEWLGGSEEASPGTWQECAALLLSPSRHQRAINAHFYSDSASLQTPSSALTPGCSTGKKEQFFQLIPLL